MNWQTVQVLLRHEMRMLMRDRRTIVLAIVLPLLVTPLMLFSAKIMNDRRMRKLEEIEYQYALTGSRADWFRTLIAETKGKALPPSTAEKGEEGGSSAFKFVEMRVTDPAAALKSGEIHFYLEALGGLEADALPKSADAEERGGPMERRSRASNPIFAEETRLRGVPLVLIHFKADRDASRAGRTKMRELLLRERRNLTDGILRQGRFPVDPKDVAEIGDTNIASASQVTGSWIGRFLTVFLLMFMLSGGSVVAMDIIAGEKERGSLETLLTTAASRAEIVAAKQLVIIAVAFVITFIQVANILVYITFKIIKLPEDFVIEAPPVTVVTLLLLFIPVAALVAAVLLMISAYAKSFKEAQLYFFPVYLLSLIPALAGVLPGISLRSAIVVVPLANVSVATREILVGKFDWPMLVITFIAMVATASWVVRASAHMLSQERLISSSETESADLLGGAALFPKHVLRWYAVLGVLLFAVNLNVPQLAPLRRQLLFNQLGIFLGGSLLMIYRYRLSIREAWALRPVKPVVWLATLFAIPSSNLVAVGVFRLANYIIPVPKQMLEQFGRELLPQDIPMWQLIIFLSILPGICEEIGFRGTLLYGLRRKYRPVSLAVAVGIIFGLFHITLFRIIPTGFLGIILTAMALLTGSIFPSMLLHAGNNAFAVWAGQAGIPLGALDWWLYLAAAVIFALSFYLIYRNRTPYPDLR